MSIIVIGKLLLSVVLGIMLGIERELKHKPIGLKTCVTISVSSCLLTIVSIEAANYFSSMSANIRTDPMRLAAQVVSGIGFLGAGAILRRSNDMISGLTTAAVIWAASGVGISVGAGFYWEAIIGASFILFTVRYLPQVLELLGIKKMPFKEWVVRLVLDDPERLLPLIGELKEQQMDVKLAAMKDADNGLLHVDCRVTAHKKLETYELYQTLKHADGVGSVKVEC